MRHAHESVGDLLLRLSVQDSNGRRWVRRADTGRTLGSITRKGNRWAWEPSPTAFRGDGRPGRERDGGPTDRVPEHLTVGSRTESRTRLAACAELVTWCQAHRAPVLGHGPHPEVTVRGVELCTT